VLSRAIIFSQMKSSGFPCANCEGHLPTPLAVSYHLLKKGSALCSYCWYTWYLFFRYL